MVQIKFVDFISSPPPDPPAQDIEAKKEAQKEKEIDEQEANASSMHRCRTALDKDLINTGIYESASKQSLPLVQLVQQLLRWLNLDPSLPPLPPRDPRLQTGQHGELP